MTDHSYSTIRVRLASHDPKSLDEGLNLVEVEIAKVGSSEAKPLFEMVSSLFYIDTLDHPELVPVLNRAITLMVGFGAWVIPVLIERLDAGDMKAQWAVAHVLGRFGADAIKPLVAAYTATTDITMRAFILYALGKIKSAKIVQALSLALDASQSSNLELRDTATRSLGKFAESIPKDQFPVDLRRKCIGYLNVNLADSNVTVRAKAIRSMGKMAKCGHLTEGECSQLRSICQNISGTDVAGNWDPAYIVRKEAEEALSYA
jgi:hypothetical protein